MSHCVVTQSNGDVTNKSFNNQEDVNTKSATGCLNAPYGVVSNEGEGDKRCQQRHFPEKCSSNIFPPFNSNATSIVNRELITSLVKTQSKSDITNKSFDILEDANAKTATGCLNAPTGVESIEGDKRCQQRHFPGKCASSIFPPFDSDASSIVNRELIMIHCVGTQSKGDITNKSFNNLEDVNTKSATGCFNSPADVESNEGEGNKRCQQRHFPGKCVSSIFPPFNSDASSIVNRELIVSRVETQSNGEIINKSFINQEDVHAKIATGFFNAPAGVKSNEEDKRCQQRHFPEKCLSSIFPPFSSDASLIVNRDLKERRSVGTDLN